MSDSDSYRHQFSSGTNGFQCLDRLWYQLGVYSFRHHIILSVIRSFCCLSIHPLSFYPSFPYPSLRSCLSHFFKIHFFPFLTFVSSVLSLKAPPPLLFFTCLPPVSFLSISLRFSITLSPLLIPLADPQREPREWVGLKRERRAVLYPARSSLARLKHSEEKKKKQHTGEESFSLSLLFSFLHLSTLLFHHSWVVWYLTFTLLQQGLGSKSSERKLVSPLSYSVIPLFLFPLPLSFLLSLLLFLPLSSNRWSL